MMRVPCAGGPNGLAQAQRRGRGEATTIIAPFLAGEHPLSGASRCRLEPVLARFSSLGGNFNLHILEGFLRLQE